ncbi:MAG: hypothetical protein SGI77_04350 [Pirellulaceae bacterium]|nr:hypothetical protein [Pirellulaceae bacterium]
MAALITSSGGNYSAIASKLGVTRQTVANRIAKDQSLVDLVSECREKLIDVAEFGLALAVKQKKAWAIKFILATLGRGRGYQKTLDVTTAGDPSIVLYLPDNGRDSLDTSARIESETKP